MSLTPKNQAPNMYFDSPNEYGYDIVMVDWRCDTDALNTFWNLNYYKLNGHPDGYSGFQNLDGNHCLIFSLWEQGTDYPEIEYISPWTDKTAFLFSNEDDGKHIYTTLNWQVGAWYTLCIRSQTMFGKTFIAQWVRKQGNSNWHLCGVFSFPVKNKYIMGSSFFMEDFDFNNLTKKCSLRNWFGRKQSDLSWHSRNQYYLSNSYYPYLEDSTIVQSNVTFDCNYGTGSSDNPHVWVQAGGEDLINPVPHSFDMPTLLSITQGSAPMYIPTFAALLPRFIQSKHSNLFVAPNSNSQIVQGTLEYQWVFEDSGDDYFYILNSDKSQAITVNSGGTTLSLASFSGSNAQKWTKRSYPQSTDVYFVPKNYPGKRMAVSGSSTAAGAAIVLSNASSTASAQKFFTLNDTTFRSIKSYASKYVAPSGNQLIQRALKYRWIFVPVDNTYFYIVTQDCLNAITVNGTNNGANLAFSPFVIGNSAQMWKLVSTGSGSFYVIPKNAQNMNMDVEGPSTSSGAFIQLWTHNTTSPQFKWVITIE